ncbi:hypothetical protein F9K50_11290 [bacterium]|nr:MAG: hypothetical protein F9K50_11290 [bacterium]
MADELRIGRLFIHDLNQNDRYDPAVDRVSDEAGQPLSGPEQARALQAILGEIRAPAWRGLSLAKVEAYARALSEARETAARGDVDQNQSANSRAERLAKELGLNFDAVRARAQRRQALQTALRRGMEAAERLSERADSADLAKSALDEVYGIAEDLKKEFAVAAYDGGRAGRILERAYRKTIEGWMNQARAQAKAVDLQGALIGLNLAEHYAHEAQSNLGIHLYPDPREVEALALQVYGEGLEKEYLRAEEQAALGNAKVTRNILAYIRDQVREANQKYRFQFSVDEPRCDRILETALVAGVEDNFRRAAEQAGLGHGDEVEKWLALARDYVAEFNREHRSHYWKARESAPLSFDEPRARAIRASLEKALRQRQP